MDTTTFHADLARDGFTEVLQRDFPAHSALAEHHHAWDARLLVLAGELQLARDGGTVRFGVGQWCEVPCGQLHAEHYGAEGTTLLIGRRYPAATAANAVPDVATPG